MFGGVQNNEQQQQQQILLHTPENNAQGRRRFYNLTLLHYIVSVVAAVSYNAQRRQWNLRHAAGAGRKTRWWRQRRRLMSRAPFSKAKRCICNIRLLVVYLPFCSSSSNALENLLPKYDDCYYRDEPQIYYFMRI